MKSAECLLYSSCCLAREPHLSKNRSLTVPVVNKQAERPSSRTRAKLQRKRFGIRSEPETTNESVVPYPTPKQRGLERKLSEEIALKDNDVSTFGKPSNAWWDESYSAYDRDEKKSPRKGKTTVGESYEKMQKFVKEGKMEMAQIWFDLMKREGDVLGVVAYTILMNGYCKAGDDKMVFDLFDEMISKGIEPHRRTFNVLINACSISTDMQKAEDLLLKMQKDYEIRPDSRTFCSFLKVCAKTGDISKAMYVYEEMGKQEIRRSVIMFNTLMNVFAEATNTVNGKEYLKECKRLLETMEKEKVQPDCRTYSALMKTCIRAGMTDEAFAMLESMADNGVLPNIFIYSMLIDGCAKAAELSKEEVLSRVDMLRKQMQMQRLPFVDATYTSLFSVCLRVEDLQKAQEYYEEAMQTGVKLHSAAYGALIKCYEKLGDPSDRDSYLNPCFEIMTTMKNRGLRLDAYIYTSLISACGNAKDIESALELWKKMKSRGIFPRPAAFGAMIKAYLSVDDIDAAISMLNEMDAINVRPNSVIFYLLFASCDKNKEVSKARFLREKMVSYNIRPNRALQNQLIRMNLL